MPSPVSFWCAAARGGDAGDIRRPRSLSSTAPKTTSVLSAADALLLDRVRAGDEVAFRECYDAHYEALWRYAVRLLDSRDAASDVVQDVFFSLFAKRETLAVRGPLRLYLLGAVRHAALNLLRHDRIVHRVATTTEFVDAVPAFGTQATRPDDALEQWDIEARVTRALSTLPERQQSAMILRWEHGLSTAQIARTLGVADTVAGRLLQKAARRRREHLTRDE